VQNSVSTATSEKRRETRIADQKKKKGEVRAVDYFEKEEGPAGVRTTLVSLDTLGFAEEKGKV